MITYTMLTQEDFKNSIDRYMFEKSPFYLCDFQEMRDRREEILSLSKAFKKHYKFRLLDLEIFAMWRWHSRDWDSRWLTVTDASKDIGFFEDFVKEFVHLG